MARSPRPKAMQAVLGHRSHVYSIDGALYLRRPYGTEPWVVEDAQVEWPAVCPDCGAKMGELHYAGCDIEVCPKCGRTVHSCGCVASS